MTQDQSDYYTFTYSKLIEKGWTASELSHHSNFLWDTTYKQHILYYNIEDSGIFPLIFPLDCYPYNSLSQIADSPVLYCLEHRPGTVAKNGFYGHLSTPRQPAVAPSEKGIFVPFPQVRKVALQLSYLILQCLFSKSKSRSHVLGCMAQYGAREPADMSSLGTASPLQHLFPAIFHLRLP